MVKKSKEEFLLTTKIYKITNNASILAPEKRKPKGKALIKPEGTVAKNQEDMTNKTIVTRKMKANEIHAKLVHPEKDRMRAIVKHLQ